MGGGEGGGPRSRADADGGRMIKFCTLSPGEESHLPAATAVAAVAAVKNAPAAMQDS